MPQRGEAGLVPVIYPWTLNVIRVVNVAPGSKGLPSIWRTRPVRTA